MAMFSLPTRADRSRALKVAGVDGVVIDIVVVVAGGIGAVANFP